MGLWLEEHLNDHYSVSTSDHSFDTPVYGHPLVLVWTGDVFPLGDRYEFYTYYSTKHHPFASQESIVL